MLAVPVGDEVPAALAVESGATAIRADARIDLHDSFLLEREPWAPAPATMTLWDYRYVVVDIPRAGSMRAVAGIADRDDVIHEGCKVEPHRGLPRFQGCR